MATTFDNDNGATTAGPPEKRARRMSPQRVASIQEYLQGELRRLDDKAKDFRLMTWKDLNPKSSYAPDQPRWMLCVPDGKKYTQLRVPLAFVRMAFGHTTGAGDVYKGADGKKDSDNTPAYNLGCVLAAHPRQVEHSVERGYGSTIEELFGHEIFVLVRDFHAALADRLDKMTRECAEAASRNPSIVRHYASARDLLPPDSRIKRSDDGDFTVESQREEFVNAIVGNEKRFDKTGTKSEHPYVPFTMVIGNAKVWVKGSANNADKAADLRERLDDLFPTDVEGKRLFKRALDTGWVFRDFDVIDVVKSATGTRVSRKTLETPALRGGNIIHGTATFALSLGKGSLNPHIQVEYVPRVLLAHPGHAGQMHVPNELCGLFDDDADDADDADDVDDAVFTTNDDTATS